MDKRKKYYIVLDVETANALEQSLVYDLGFVVCDKKGNIYESRSYIIKDIFFDESAVFENYELMATSYYAEKLPKYYLGIKNHSWSVAPLMAVRKEIINLMKEYNINTVWAYNCNFDKNALNNTLRYVTKSKFRWFFPYGTQFNCIWNFACQTLLSQKSFLKMAVANGWVSDSGNIKTSAEMAYRYIADEKTFEEAHTGLEDVIIETKILARCFAQHKKADKGINRSCWRIPTKVYRETVA